jgi:hypothetical protein
VIGAFVRDLPPLHETEKPVSFDPVQTTFLQKLVRDATLKEGVTVDKEEFFKAVVCVDYFTEVIAARPTLLGDIAVVVEELDKMADYLDPDLELLVRYIGVYIGKDLKGEALFKKGSQEAIARRHERTNATPVPGGEVDLFHEAVGNFVLDQIRNEKLRAWLPHIKGRNDLRALFLLDAMATAMPNEVLPPLDPLLPAVMDFLSRLTKVGWSLREHVERLKARL